MRQHGRLALHASAAAVVGLLWATGSIAQTQVQQSQPGLQDQPEREIIYCSELMTHEEREAYRQRMRRAGSAEEREQLRAAHQAEMQARARQKGNEGLCKPKGRGGGQGPQNRGGR